MIIKLCESRCCPYVEDTLANMFYYLDEYVYNQRVGDKTNLPPTV